MFYLAVAEIVNMPIHVGVKSETEKGVPTDRLQFY
jgi:hypothetical protein